MNKTELVQFMAEKAGIPKKSAALALSAAIVAINVTTSRGNSISIAGLGSFKTVRRSAKVGRHPATGVPIPIPAKSVKVFKPSASPITSVL